MDLRFFNQRMSIVQINCSKGEKRMQSADKKRKARCSLNERGATHLSFYAYVNVARAKIIS